MSIKLHRCTICGEAIFVLAVPIGAEMYTEELIIPMSLPIFVYYMAAEGIADFKLVCSRCGEVAVAPLTSAEVKV